MLASNSSIYTHQSNRIGRLVQLAHGGLGFKHTWSHQELLSLAIRNGRAASTWGFDPRRVEKLRCVYWGM